MTIEERKAQNERCFARIQDIASNLFDGERYKLESKVGKLEIDINRLEKEADKLATDIYGLEKDIDKLNESDMYELKGEKRELESAKRELEMEKSGLISEKDELESEMYELKSEMDKLEIDINDFKIDMNEMEAYIANNLDKICNEEAEKTHIPDGMIEKTLPETVEIIDCEQQSNLPWWEKIIDAKLKVRFVKKLFDGNESVYHKLLQDIDNCSTWSKADACIVRYLIRVKKKHTDSVAVEFCRTIEKRFLENT